MSELLVSAEVFTPPKITSEDVEAAIVSEYFFTAQDGVVGNPDIQEVSNRDFNSLSLLTFCVLVLGNGFKVVGTSACVSHDTFDAQVGREIAREDAKEKIWPLLGFRLSDQLVRGQTECATMMSFS